MTEKIQSALKHIAQSPAGQERFIELLLQLEPSLRKEGLDVREEITGPLVDGLYGDDDRLQKTLSDGTVVEFLYRSKIARDFLMSQPSVPDHVWEPQTTKLLVHLAKGCRTAVVGGAYFGDQAILIAKEMAKSGGTLHAFEPNKEQMGMLRRNMELNGVRNIEVQNKGLWDSSSAHLTLVGYDSFAHPEQAEAGAEDAFSTVTIDEYLESAGASTLDLIMLDIEGAELRALQGARRMIERSGSGPAIVFEVHRHYVDWTNGLQNTDIIRYLSSLGYTSYAVRDYNSNHDMAGLPVELIPADAVYLEGPPHGFNMMAVKDPARVSGPEFRIRRGVSPKLLLHRDPKLHQPVPDTAA
ncbi:MAG TPA: FkbM family methyltransferase [Azospirillaceae bacterium]|nr:FkbM family methyltransferase [Azospirillaceae bacterium]